jgi:hypothetical protein
MKWFAALVVSAAVLVSLAVVSASSSGTTADLSAYWTATEGLGPYRTRAAALYLPSPTCRIMLYGGAGPNGVATGETFLYEPLADDWVELPLQKGTTRPPAVSQAGLAWDADQKLAVLFGGFGSTALSNVSLFNPSTLKWSAVDFRRCSASTCPGARYSHAQVWSHELKATLVFGGVNSSTAAYMVYNDLWKLKASPAPKGGLTWTWSRLAPKPDPNGHGYPQARFNHGMAEIPYPPDRHKLLIYGGLYRTQSSSSTSLADTWLYDPVLNQFEYVDTVPPTLRAGFALGYSPSLGMIIANGGRGSDASTSETWAFDLDTRTWVQIVTESIPPTRSNHDLASDPSGSCGDFNAYIVEAPVNYGGPDFTWFLRMP